MNYMPKNEMIKKNLKRLAFVAATIILATATIFLTKINVTSNIIPNYTSAQNPVESFIFVERQVIHIQKACLPLTDDDPCDLYDIDEDGRIDPDPSPTPFSASSSGSLIGHNVQLNESYILTAYHVCADLDGPKFMGVLIDIKEEKEGIDIPPHLLILEIANLHTVTDYRGREYKAGVLRGDPDNDVCILKATHIPGVRPIKIADEPAPVNSKIYNIASPRSLSVPGAVITFEGYITGVRPNGFHMFSLPVGPGSSGSPVLNEYGEIVSIVSHGYPWAIHRRTGWEANIAGGPQFKAIKDLVNPYQIQ
jgi:S1-C subfamily serine protease